MEKKIEALIEQINDLGIKAEKVVINKNGIDRTGITLGDGPIRPTLYPDFEEIDDVKRCAVKMIQAYHEHKNLDGVDELMDILKNWDKAKEYIYPCVMKAYDTTRIMKPFLDLTIYYRFMKDEMSVVIKPQLLDLYDITINQLHETALDNLKKVITIQTMGEALNGMVDEEIPCDLNMVVVSNKSRHYGASAILITEIFETIKTMMKSDIVIIPSSVHELIVIPKTGSIEEINAMIVETNNTAVEPQDVLCDHAYYLDTQITF